MKELLVSVITVLRLCLKKDRPYLFVTFNYIYMLSTIDETKNREREKTMGKTQHI